jgi:outer membrane protein OmpA-like peptidoglycan-associated protein
VKLALAAGVLVPSTALAQTTSGWALDRYEPSPAGDTFFAAEHPWYGHNRDFMFRGGLTLDYANRPLVFRRYRDNQETAVETVVSDMMLLHLQAGIGLWNRVGIHLSIPVSVWQDGAVASVGGLGAAESAALGDPRLGVRVRIFGESDFDPISLHVGGSLFLNAGWFGVERASNVTDDGLRGRVNVTLAGRGGPIRWSFGTGLHFRERSVSVFGTEIGNDLFASAAVGFVALDDRLTIGPELWASTVLSQAFQEKHFNAEATLGAHYLIADTVQVGLGVGPGFTQGAGTPTWRLLANVAYAPSEHEATPPPVPDTDNDGVLDPEDQCPTTPMGSHPDPARIGCPLNDTDGDGIYDNDDQCVTEPQGERPDPNRRGCPLRDRDGDGVFDDDDQCADTPQGDTPDPERRGCPDGDDDHDGVRNSQDQCRTTPQGPLPDPNRRGCPIADRDHDRVPDSEDRCPDQPGAPSTNPARNGCPGLVTIDGTVLRILRPVYFALDQDRILSTSSPVLEAVADALRAATYIHRVRIEGHTDDQADDAYNLDLSQRRANNVRRWLVAHGIDESRLEAQGFGESRPRRAIDGLTGSALRDARAENRRVLFVVTDPAPPEGDANPEGTTTVRQPAN